MANLLTYTGEFLKSQHHTLDLDPYNPSEELVESVNLAIFLERPLLLMGEPGCGKTRLAESVAAELHGAKWKDHFFRWDIKSSSKAKDGIYWYDGLTRLYHANSSNAQTLDVENYITYGEFAKALTKTQNGNAPNILLIDEIDKADMDFPNDLLLEIEKGEFLIQELNKKIERHSKIIIFITSNRERELPPAFLRRCLFHYIKFPSKKDIVEIVNSKFDRQDNSDLVENAVNLFLDIREKMDNQFAEYDKKPSTSELIEWFKLINEYHKMNKLSILNATQSKILKCVEEYVSGNIDSIEIPFPQVLLKSFESNQIFESKI